MLCRRTSTRETVLKIFSVLGIAIGAALLSAAPVSIQPSPATVVQLSLDKAEAQSRAYRRRLPRVVITPRYYGGPGPYDYGRGYANPYPLFSTWSYGLYPTAYGAAYRVMPWWW
jgi:hypothetical protein